jgi:molecular chaperone DnaK
MKEVIAGIDLGTTNSAIAFVKEGGAEIIPIDGQPTMPSCVGIDPNGKLLVGLPARNMLVASSESTVLSIKRKMGQDTRIMLGEKSLSPVEISSFILRRLKEEAEKFLDQPVRKAVITVPAFFDENQRKATQDAGTLADLEVVRIINEPTAAALAYDAGHSGDERILVYDLGGGTFDVSVVVVEGGVVEVKASHGDTQLGGDDFDQLLIQHVVDEFHQRHNVYLNENPRTSRRLKLILERAKCQLSDEPFVRLREEYIHQDLHLEMEIQRLAYEEMIEPYLQKTLDCIHRALQDARLVPRDITKVMLVGGATRTPLVHQLIEQRLRITPRWEINPDLIVALGASIAGAGMAGEKTKSILVDITAHSFGIEAVGMTDEGDRNIYMPILHRNTPLPVSKSEIFSTYHDFQTQVDITVFEGEDPDPVNNTFIGQFRIEGLRKIGRGNPILVNLNLDLNGMLKVTATEKETGLNKTVTLDTRGAKSGPQLEEARKNIQSLLQEPANQGTDEEQTKTGRMDDQTLLRTAKDLRKRAEALLERGVSAEDASEIQNLLHQSSEAIKLHDKERLSALNEPLSDILYYLED